MESLASRDSERTAQAGASVRPLRVVVMMATSSPWSRLLVTSLAALGVSVHVVDFTPAHAADYLTADEAAAASRELEGRIDGLHRLHPPRRLPGQLAWAAWKLREIVRRSDADVVLSLYGGTSALTAFLSGTRPYVVYVVGSDVLLADWIRRSISRITLARAARVLANGQHLAVKARQIAPRARVQNLYIGIELQRFPRKTDVTRSPTFVCTRVFRPIYDNATIVRAVGLLQNIPPDFRLSFVSAGPLLSDAMALADEKLTPAARARVDFAGWASDSALAAALRSAAFYVSASLSDGSSSSLLEAMATGLIPIVSDIPANREWVVHEENGLLFAPGDAAALARCMDRAMAGEPWMKGAIERNVRIVAERADAHASVRGLLEVLELEGRAKAPPGPGAARR